jgi:uncharacterized protein YcbK (DUF882 family)
MRKHHLTIGLGLLLAVGTWPTRVRAKPQATAQKASAPAVMSAAAESARARGQDKERSAPRSKTRAKKRETPPPCFAKAVEFARDLGSELETRSLSLSYCDGKPNLAALEALSVLARSRHVERPESAQISAYQKLSVDKGPRSKRRDPAYVTPQVMRLHEGLVQRLQQVADHFPGKAFELVSGHRPEARFTSRHHHGRALDFRVRGVSRERLRDLLRSFEATGVGYYPNSTFVHMDVREDKGYWVDRSGPGEAADYGVWPPPKHEVEDAEDRILRGALADLAELGHPIAQRAAEPLRRASEPSATLAPARRERSLESAQRLLSVAISASLPQPESGSPARADAEPGDQLSASEVAKIRQEALRALEGLH